MAGVDAWRDVNSGSGEPPAGAPPYMKLGPRLCLWIRPSLGLDYGRSFSMRHQQAYWRVSFLIFQVEWWVPPNPRRDCVYWTYDQRPQERRHD